MWGGSPAATIAAQPSMPAPSQQETPVDIEAVALDERRPIEMSFHKQVAAIRIGISLWPPSADVTEGGRWPVVVAQTHENTIASSMFVPGDRILTVNGAAVATPTEAVGLLKAAVGEVVMTKLPPAPAYAALAANAKVTDTVPSTPHILGDATNRQPVRLGQPQVPPIDTTAINPNDADANKSLTARVLETARSSARRVYDELSAPFVLFGAIYSGDLDSSMIAKAGMG